MICNDATARAKDPRTESSNAYLLAERESESFEAQCHAIVF